MTQSNVGPTSPRTQLSALYSDIARRPPAQAPAPQALNRVLTPLHGALVARPLPRVAATPRSSRPTATLGFVRPSNPAACRNTRLLLLVLAQQLSQRHAQMLRANTLAQLTIEDRGYCDKLLHLNRAFGDILNSTRNFTVNMEHLHEDMARLLSAHLQHGSALLGNPVLVMTKNLSYKSFAANEGERPAPVLLKVPLDNHDTWLPTGHKLLHAIATLCPLPAISGQVAHFYGAMADLAEARQNSSEHETLKRMFGEVAQNWRDYSIAIAQRSSMPVVQMSAGPSAAGG